MFLAFILYTYIAIPLFILIESSVISIGFLTFFLLLSMFLFKKSWFDYYPFSYHIIAQRDLSFGKWKGFNTADIVVIVYILISLISGAILFNKYKN